MYGGGGKCPRRSYLMNIAWEWSTSWVRKVVILCAVGYADDKIVLDWMNTTEPMDTTSEATAPVIINNHVELPQFEVVGSESERCNKRYHQKSGKPLLLPFSDHSK